MITSKDNKYLKELRALQNKKERDASGLFVIEGLRNAAEAIASDWDIEYALYSSEDNCRDLLDALRKREVPCFDIEAGLLERAADARTCQGLVLVAKQKSYNCADVFASGKTIAVLDGVADPGNAGTIIRTARAAGLGGLLFMPNSVDFYNPKVVRSAMGALYRTPCVQAGDEEILAAAKAAGYQVVILDMAGEVVNVAEQPEKKLYILGNEAHGISDFWRNAADMSLSIPMADNTESLNVSVAAGIVFFSYIWQK